MTHPPDVSLPMEAEEFNKSIATHRRSVGSAGEFIVAADLSALGVLISFPVTTAPRYDLVADYDGRLFRVQVKAKHEARGKVKIPTGSYRDYRHSYSRFGSLTRKYQRGDFDIMAAVDNATRVVYYVPESLLDYSMTYLTPTDEQLGVFASFLKVLDIL